MASGTKKVRVPERPSCCAPITPDPWLRPPPSLLLSSLGSRVAGEGSLSTPEADLEGQASALALVAGISLWNSSLGAAHVALGTFRAHVF